MLLLNLTQPPKVGAGPQSKSELHQSERVFPPELSMIFTITAAAWLLQFVSAQPRVWLT